MSWLCKLGFHRWKPVKREKKYVWKELCREFEKEYLVTEYLVCERCGVIYYPLLNCEPYIKIDNTKLIERIKECIEDKGDYYLIKSECLDCENGNG